MECKKLIIRKEISTKNTKIEISRGRCERIKKSEFIQKSNVSETEICVSRFASERNQFDYEISSRGLVEDNSSEQDRRNNLDSSENFNRGDNYELQHISEEGEIDETGDCREKSPTITTSAEFREISHSPIRGFDDSQNCIENENGVNYIIMNTDDNFPNGCFENKEVEDYQIRSPTIATSSVFHENSDSSTTEYENSQNCAENNDEVILRNISTDSNCQTNIVRTHEAGDYNARLPIIAALSENENSCTGGLFNLHKYSENINEASYVGIAADRNCHNDNTENHAAGDFDRQPIIATVTELNENSDSSTGELTASHNYTINNKETKCTDTIDGNCQNGVIKNQKAGDYPKYKRSPIVSALIKFHENPNSSVEDFDIEKRNEAEYNFEDGDQIDTFESSNIPIKKYQAGKSHKFEYVDDEKKDYERGRKFKEKSKNAKLDSVLNDNINKMSFTNDLVKQRNMPKYTSKMTTFSVPNLPSQNGQTKCLRPVKQKNIKSRFSEGDFALTCPKAEIKGPEVNKEVHNKSVIDLITHFESLNSTVLKHSNNFFSNLKATMKSSACEQDMKGEDLEHVISKNVYAVPLVSEIQVSKNASNKSDIKRPDEKIPKIMFSNVNTGICQNIFPSTCTFGKCIHCEEISTDYKNARNNLEGNVKYIKVQASLCSDEQLQKIEHSKMFNFGRNQSKFTYTKSDNRSLNDLQCTKNDDIPAIRSNTNKTRKRIRLFDDTTNQIAKLDDHVSLEKKSTARQDWKEKYILKTRNRESSGIVSIKNLITLFVLAIIFTVFVCAVLGKSIVQ